MHRSQRVSNGAKSRAHPIGPANLKARIASALELSDARVRPILLAYFTTTLSKAMTVAVQIIALPVAARVVGGEQFGIMLTVASIGSLLLVPALGLGPAMSLMMADARGRDDEIGISRAFVHGSIFSIGVGIGLPLVGMISIRFVNPVTLVGGGAAVYPETVRMCWYAMLIHVGCMYMFNFVDGARAAYFENFITNAFSALSSVIALVLTVLVAFFEPKTSFFYVALFVTYPAIQSINLIIFSINRRESLFIASVNLKDFNPFISQIVNYARAQAGILLHTQGLVYLTTHLVGLSAGGVVGAIFRLFSQIANVCGSLINPVIPTLSHARATNDEVWTRKAVWFALLTTGMIIIAAGTGVAMFGRQIADFWLKMALPPGSDIPIALGIWGALYCATYVVFIILMAIGRGRDQGYILLGSGVVATSAMLVAIPSFGLASGMWINATLMGGATFLVGVPALIREIH